MGFIYPSALDSSAPALRLHCAKGDEIALIKHWVGRTIGVFISRQAQLFVIRREQQQPILRRGTSDPGMNVSRLTSATIPSSCILAN